jgi:mannose-6-phosphate isomerase-like protein (cupin superfamily)
MPSINGVYEIARRTSDGYHEFLRVPSLSAGVYALAAGATDRQTPHTEDEIYYVVRGQGKLRRGDEDLDAGPGEVLFVPARQPHHFHSIQKELLLLVVFGPAEGTKSGSAPP